MVQRCPLRRFGVTGRQRRVGLWYRDTMTGTLTPEDHEAMSVSMVNLYEHLVRTYYAGSYQPAPMERLTRRLVALREKLSGGRKRYALYFPSNWNFAVLPEWRTSDWAKLQELTRGWPVRQREGVTLGVQAALGAFDVHLEAMVAAQKGDTDGA